MKTLFKTIALTLCAGLAFMWLCSNSDKQSDSASVPSERDAGMKLAAPAPKLYPSENDFGYIAGQYVGENCLVGEAAGVRLVDVSDPTIKTLSGGYTRENGHKVYLYQVKGWLDLKAHLQRLYFGINLRVWKAGSNDKDAPGLNHWVRNAWVFDVLITTNKLDQSKCQLKSRPFADSVKLKGFEIDVPVAQEFDVSKCEVQSNMSLLASAAICAAAADIAAAKGPR